MLTCCKFNRYWSRSRFNTNVKCDTLVNNVSEAFNSMIVDARSKPIITMLEDIRLYMMNTWASNRLKVNSFEGSICPRIRDRLDKELQLTKYWVPRYCSHFIGLFYIFKIVTGLIIFVLFFNEYSWSADKLFEVRHVSTIGEKFVVNMDKMDCSCRK